MLRPGRGKCLLKAFILFFFFCFSLSSPYLCHLLASQKQKVASVGLAPLKAVKRGAQSTPGSARPRSPPPLTREEEERPPRLGRTGVTGEDTEGPSGGGRGTEVPGARGDDPGPWGHPPCPGCGPRGTPRPGQTEGRHVEVALNTAPPMRPHGKGPVQPEAPGERRGRHVLGQGPDNLAQPRGSGGEG